MARRCSFALTCFLSSLSGAKIAIRFAWSQCNRNPFARCSKYPSVVHACTIGNASFSTILQLACESRNIPPLHTSN
ncbi:hypothetical protein PF005_g33205 [Phytophthora fragariae]|uniref:Secreted protein n=1 Tax=Phytophthora fragariae TaxID=53985 RepID=A0A6A3V3P8_9STRA|nr:hypothetical protein PF009_g33023 [Phytophthora fragariae]KAE8952606.1 hypothetical protein PF011_g32656 [Phytophthora fragariae]KAE9053599.1 hypothetical protein PF007_g32905 [Phytophthora fragariae]KAE9054978.1 hypothetical protein PF006_g33107 [Phytophthora fragariae]KAE9156457.1 hypothetical protein PF005_g33205 [Phytophthora fragariae]